jgi:hypothetical protein
MSVVLDLPADLESKLTSEAHRLGLPVSEYVVRILSRTAERPQLHTGQELLHYWQSEGLVGARSDISDSPAHARHLRQQAERRTRP